MTGRARSTVAALRSRLSVALVVGLLGPSVLLAGAVGVWLPQHERALALGHAKHDARAAAVALRATCEAVNEAATATARQVQQYATAADYGAVPRAAAEAAAKAAVASRPGSAVAVFDPDWGLLALAGSKAGRGPAAAGGYGASCSSGMPGSDLRVGGLAEVKRVDTAADGLVAHVAFWLPVDDASLAALRERLAAGGQLTVIGPGARVLATSVAGGPVGTPAGDDRERLGRAVDRLTDGHASGLIGGLGYAVEPAGPDLPFQVLATARVAGPALPLLLAPALLLLLVALVPIRSLAGRLSEPVDLELRHLNGELRAGRTALAQSFSRFGEALEHTHDLERLLNTVAAFCLHGTGAVAGVALLTDETPGRPEPEPGTPASLRSRGAARTTTADAEAALAELPAVAERYFRALTASPGTPWEPHFATVLGAGPVVAVPVRSGERLVGMLALARGKGAPAFDALALPRVLSVADHVGTAVANVRLHEEVRRLSVTDPLTGVGNVRQLSTTLSRELAGAIRFDRPLAVLMIDLDHFKRVNDTLGHQFGDVVLREFAQRVAGCVREIDTVARYGGEEFAVVLRDTDVEGGARVAERVLAAMREQPFRHGELFQTVTASIGVAAFPGHGRTAADVLHAADEALYAAKREGRDRYAVAGSPEETAISQAG